METTKSYIICANPRSGSTLLCRLLSETGVAGNPASYFHMPELAAWIRALNVSVPPGASQSETVCAIIAAALKEGSGGTDVFGLRLMRKSFDFLMRQIDVLYPDLPSDAARFDAVFAQPRYIHLTRGDKVSQAVSLVMAEQTGLWHKAPDGSEIERTAPPKDPIYNGDEIGKNVDELVAYDREWLRWFMHEGIDPILVTYEELAMNPTGTLRRILKELGLNDQVAEDVRPSVAKLADETSRNWVERFRKERGLGRGDTA